MKRAGKEPVQLPRKDAYTAINIAKDIARYKARQPQNLSQNLSPHFRGPFAKSIFLLHCAWDVYNFLMWVSAGYMGSLLSAFAGCI